MTPVPGAFIVTLKDPCSYTRQQIDLACAVALGLHRGQFVLIEAPRRTT